MNKATKGALAAGAAAVLLLGGAGTLAYWTDDAEVDVGPLTSGSIDLGDVECEGWLYVADDSEVSNIVPGDTVYNDCETTLTLLGDNIAATLQIDEASIDDSTPLGQALNPLPVQLLDAAGSPISDVTGEGETAVTARITVEFDYDGPVSDPDPRTDADNTTQAGTAALDGLELIAVQTNVDLP